MAKKDPNFNRYELSILNKAFTKYANDNNLEANLDNFKDYLKQNKASTKKAEQIFNLMNGKTKSKIKFGENEFKIRKTHKIRDFSLKKVIIPGLISAGVVTGLAFFALSVLTTHGQSFLWFNASTTPGVMFSNALIPGLGFGLLTSSAIITSKGYMTRRHYNKKYKSGKETLLNYDDSKINQLELSNLISQIEAGTHKVLESKGLKKHLTNAINRNGIHHVQKVNKYFNKQYKLIKKDILISKNEIENIKKDEKLSSDIRDESVKAKTEELKNKIFSLKKVYDILKMVDTYITNDIEEQRNNSLFTGKKKPMFENLDIYGSILISNKNIMNKGNSKKIKNSIKNRKKAALEIINGASTIPNVADFEKNFLKYCNKGNVVSNSNYNSKDNTITYELENGEQATYSVTDVGTKEVSNIKSTAKADTIYYTDGSTKEFKKPQPTNIPEIPVARKDILNDLIALGGKVEGFNKTVVTNLIMKLIEDQNNPQKKLPLTKQQNELYTHVLNYHKNNADQAEETEDLTV